MEDVETFEVRAEVIAVIPSYRQAIARSADNQHQLAITRHTQGVALEDVHEGQVYLLTVTCRLARVLHAQLADLDKAAHELPKKR